MMTRDLENINHRLRYDETVKITRDELNAIEEEIAAAESDYALTQKKIEELLHYKKQRDLAREIIEGLVECIDDDGVVTPAEKTLLSQRIKSAVKFINNLED